MKRSLLALCLGLMAFAFTACQPDEEEPQPTKVTCVVDLINDETGYGFSQPLPNEVVFYPATKDTEAYYEIYINFSFGILDGCQWRLQDGTVIPQASKTKFRFTHFGTIANSIPDNVWTVPFHLTCEKAE